MATNTHDRVRAIRRTKRIAGQLLNEGMVFDAIQMATRANAEEMSLLRDRQTGFTSVIETLNTR